MQYRFNGRFNALYAIGGKWKPMITIAMARLFSSEKAMAK